MSASDSSSDILNNFLLIPCTILEYYHRQQNARISEDVQKLFRNY